MTPEDVLLEAIAAASLHGDSPSLRRQACAKLNQAINMTPRDDGREPPDNDDEE